MPADADAHFNPPPGWPPPPRGWQPPPGWRPPQSWPAAPTGWRFFTREAPLELSPEVPDAPVPLEPEATRAVRGERRDLALETTFVMIAFLASGVLSAVIVFVRSIYEHGDSKLFSTIVAGHPVVNLILGIIAYLDVAAIVPLALLLLARTGQRPKDLGLGRLRLGDDVVPGAGIMALSFACEIALGVLLIPLLRAGHHAVNSVSVGNVPSYYLVWGIAISAVTAITEEVVINGYLITRLEQLGFRDTPALLLSLTLRTSYHVYYGLGFLLTVPFGYFATRSFQQRRRLNRVIVAHFLYDVAVFSLAIFTR